MTFEREHTADIEPTSSPDEEPLCLTAESLDEFIKLAEGQGATAVSGGVTFSIDQPKGEARVKFQTGLMAITTGKDVYFREEYPERIDSDVFAARHPNPVIRFLQLRTRRSFVANALIVHAYEELKTVAERLPGVETMLFSNGRRMDREFQSGKRIPEILDLAVLG